MVKVFFLTYAITQRQQAEDGYLTVSDALCSPRFLGSRQGREKTVKKCKLPATI